RLLPAQSLDILAGSHGDVARSERLAARGESPSDGFLLKGSKACSTIDQRLPAASKLGTRSKRGLLQPLSFGELRRQCRCSLPNDGKRRIQQQSHFDEFIGAAPIGKHEQGRPTRHCREAREERRGWLLFGGKLMLVRYYKGRR